jgi:hypothetical protein
VNQWASDRALPGVDVTTGDFNIDRCLVVPDLYIEVCLLLGVDPKRNLLGVAVNPAESVGVAGVATRRGKSGIRVFLSMVYVTVVV